MKQTEGLMRYTSLATTELVYKTALERLAFPKSKDIDMISRMSMSEQRASHILRNALKVKPKQLTDMINMLRTVGHENMEVAFLKFKEAGITDRMLQWGHITTQGAPALPWMPAWLSKDWAKPLSLFYRIAYQVTNAMIQHTAKPLFVDGNPVPILRYIAGAGLSGYALYSYDYAVLGREAVNKLKGGWHMLEQWIIMGEGLGLASNSFDEYESTFWETYKPTLIRMGQSVAGNVSQILRNIPGGKLPHKTVGQALWDMAKDNIVFLSHSSKIMAEHGTKVFGDLLYNKELVKRRQDLKRKQRHFEEAFFKDNRIWDDSEDRFLSEYTPYYRSVRESFWSGDQKEKARHYYAALNFIMRQMMESGPVGAKKWKPLRPEAERRLNNIISNKKIIPDAWKKKKKYERISRYDMFRSKLTSEEKKELKAMEVVYNKMVQDYERAKRVYKKEFDKTDDTQYLMPVIN